MCNTPLIKFAILYLIVVFSLRRYGMVPIVMGARRKDYDKVAPPNSFIHVDDFSGPQELARYLHNLSNNNTKYGEYFLWKKTMNIASSKNNAQFWCRLCNLLNYQVTHYSVNKIRAINKQYFIWNIRSFRRSDGYAR